MCFTGDPQGIPHTAPGSRSLSEALTRTLSGIPHGDPHAPAGGALLPRLFLPPAQPRGRGPGHVKAKGRGGLTPLPQRALLTWSPGGGGGQRRKKVPVDERALAVREGAGWGCARARRGTSRGVGKTTPRARRGGGGRRRSRDGRGRRRRRFVSALGRYRAREGRAGPPSLAPVPGQRSSRAAAPHLSRPEAPRARPRFVWPAVPRFAGRSVSARAGPPADGLRGAAALPYFPWRPPRGSFALA